MEYFNTETGPIWSFGAAETWFRRVVKLREYITAVKMRWHRRMRRHFLCSDRTQPARAKSKFGGRNCASRMGITFWRLVLIANREYMYDGSFKNKKTAHESL